MGLPRISSAQLKVHPAPARRRGSLALSRRPLQESVHALCVQFQTRVRHRLYQSGTNTIPLHLMSDWQMNLNPQLQEIAQQ